MNNIKEKFNNLLNSVSYTTDGSFDEFYQLCKKFVDEVDKSVHDGRSFNENDSEEELG